MPLIKRVAAATGDIVCARGTTISVNGVVAASRRKTDLEGRRLPWWHGCLTLDDETVFLLASSRDSFDGRYFGPTSRRDLIGSAVRF